MFGLFSLYLYYSKSNLLHSGVLMKMNNETQVHKLFEKEFTAHIRKFILPVFFL